MNRYPEPPPPLDSTKFIPSVLIFPGRTAGSPAYGQSSWLYAAADCHLVYLPASGLFFAVILHWLPRLLAYRNFGNIEPTVYYLIQGCQFALSILVSCLLYLLIYRPAPAKIIPSQRVNPLVFLSLTFIGLGLSLFLTCLPRHLWSVFLTYSLGTLLPIKWQPPPCRLWPLGCFDSSRYFPCIL